MEEKHQLLEQVAPVVGVLLQRFSGLESVIEEPSEMPEPLIQGTIQRMINGDDEKIIEALSELPLFKYRVAALPSMDIWDPRHECYADFIHRNEGATIRWWTECASSIPEPQIKEWLEELWRGSTRRGR